MIHLLKCTYIAVFIVQSNSHLPIDITIQNSNSDSVKKDHEEKGMVIAIYEKDTLVGNKNN